MEGGKEGESTEEKELRVVKEGEERQEGSSLSK